MTYHPLLATKAVKSSYLISIITFDHNFYWQIPRIQKDAFSKAFKEFKYLQYELSKMREFDAFECPPCHVSQHAAIFDGNMKTYRYKSAGRWG